jgi:hypothetical protein
MQPEVLAAVPAIAASPAEIETIPKPRNIIVPNRSKCISPRVTARKIAHAMDYTVIPTLVQASAAPLAGWRLQRSRSRNKPPPRRSVKTESARPPEAYGLYSAPWICSPQLQLVPFYLITHGIIVAQLLARTFNAFAPTHAISETA